MTEYIALPALPAEQQDEELNPEHGPMGWVVVRASDEGGMVAFGDGYMSEEVAKARAYVISAGKQPGTDVHNVEPMTQLVLTDGSIYDGRLLTDDDGKPKVEVATCGHCGFEWNDALLTELTPPPSARCPNEYNHVYEDDDEGEWTRESFCDYLRSTLIPDLRESGSTCTADDFETALKFMEMEI